MRMARVKDVGEAWYHLYDRVAGWPDDRPFGPEERRRCWRVLEEVADLFCVRIVAAVVMGNHLHLIVVQPAEPPTEEEVCRRYERYYRGRRKLVVGTAECRRWQQRLSDISWMMRILKGRLTLGFNRFSGRRGPFWADRFRSVVLGNAEAIWNCWKYVEANPVRAGIASRLGQYSDGTLGKWVRQGAHPWAGEIEDVVLRWLGEYLGVRRLEEVKARLLAGLVNGATGSLPGHIWVFARVVGPWGTVVRLTGHATRVPLRPEVARRAEPFSLWIANQPRGWKT